MRYEMVDDNDYDDGLWLMIMIRDDDDRSTWWWKWWR